MTSVWYCLDCECEIETEAIEGHESAGHTVKGEIRPERLLRNDPWNVGIEGDGSARVDAQADPEK